MKKKLRVFLARMRGLVRGSQDTTGDDIETNLQLHIDENIARGMSLEEARRDAVLQLGGLASAKEAYRDQATLPVIEDLLRDLRFAVRQLRKHPGFTSTAVATLGLGVCASVAIFAFVDAAFFRPLPYKDPQRLVGVYEKIEKYCPLCNVSYPDYLDYKAQNTVFSDLAVYQHNGMMLRTAAGAVPAFCTRVSAGFFRTLGVSPKVGRDFRPDDDKASAAPTAILSYGKWQRDFGGKESALGQTVLLDGAATQIIGVLPSDFHFAPSEPSDYWVALQAHTECDLRRSCHGLYGVARLKPGVTFETALADVVTIAKRLEKQYPGSNKEQGANLAPLTEVVFGAIRPILRVLQAGAILLLLIATVNVSSLLLVRTESRGRELAIRRGLGASAARIGRQFVIEGLVLVSLGTGLGLSGAYFVTRLLQGLLSQEALLRMPYLNDLGFHRNVWLFACAVALFAACWFSAIPIISSRLANTRERLAEGGRGASSMVWRRVGSSLVVTELAIGVILLGGAGLLAESLHHLLKVELGIEPDHVVLVDVAVPQKTYPKDEQVVALARKMLGNVSVLPGVRSAAIATKSPVTFAGNTTWFKIVGRAWHGEHNGTPLIGISPDYLQTMGATLLRGRAFNDNDRATSANVAIVNETFARQYFPHEDVIGKQISPLRDPPAPIEIVGEVRDIKEASLESETRATLYYPFSQATETYFSLAARCAGGDTQVLAAMPDAIHKIAPDVLVMQPRTMPEQIGESESAYAHRSLALLVGGFAGFALVLSVIGLYGVIAYSVSLRTREVGVRIALGAQRGNVYRLVLSDAGKLILFGLLVGAACSVEAARLMRSLLFGVTSRDAPGVTIGRACDGAVRSSGERDSGSPGSHAQSSRCTARRVIGPPMQASPEACRSSRARFLPAAASV